MKLIVGLGNPGSKYAKTRHNLGFLAVDLLSSNLGNTSWELSKFDSEIVKINNHLILAKPQTYVNNSGKALFQISNFYKIKPEGILIIRDDIDLPEGKVRGPKLKSGSGGHLGVESIREHLGTGNFYQLKIGVGRPKNDLDPADFVLEKVNDNEWQGFTNLISGSVIQKIKDWINDQG